MIKPGDKIKVHYIGSLIDGTVFDQSEKNNPLEFIVGEGSLISGFENAVVGMRLNQEKRITIPAEEGYGKRDENLINEIDKNLLPADFEIKIGKIVMLEDELGNQIPGPIVEVKTSTVLIDLNHPLADKTLVFDIKIVDIENSL